jgi:hypothetical protein
LRGVRSWYLIWIENRLGVVEAEKFEDDDDDDVIDGLEEVVDDQNRLGCNVTVTTNNYSLAKRPPFQNLTVDNILLKFGAIDFISALSTFLRLTFPGTTVLPSIHDRFNSYKQLVIKLPHNPYLNKRRDRIRMSPLVKANGRSPERLAHFDTALIIEDSQLYKSNGGIAGKFFYFNKFPSF